METRCVFPYWSLLSALVVVMVLGDVAPAQTPNAPARAGAQQTTTPDQERIPADHYDPDDLKTYEDVVNEDRSVSIRGHEFFIHLYRPRTRSAAVPAIYACGDGGWRGLAPRTAQQLAHLGFAVAGLDSKVYLRELSSPEQPLTISKLASDYVEIARALRPYANVNATTPVFVYGWSLGAGFAVAVGSDLPTRANWAGIISIGLPAQNQLVSGLGANHVNLMNSVNSRYGFRTEAVMPGLSPVPLVMIQSTSDTASPPKVGKALFAAARDPKQYVLIKAENHRFSGARNEFYAALANAMTWIEQARGNANPVKATEGNH
jgi:dienelactone hydrolase